MRLLRRLRIRRRGVAAVGRRRRWGVLRMRRGVAAGLVVAVVAAAVGTGATGGGAAAVAADQVTTGAPRPNIVFILADDLDATTTPYWDAMPKSKALLADQGLVFTNAFSPTPICCPARATILTGKYGHNTGVLTNGGDLGGWETFVENGHEDETVAVGLQGAGYSTALFGKYLNGIEEDPTHVPPGWTEWYGGADNNLYTGYDYALNENGTLVDYGHDESDYATDVIAAKAVDFVARADANDDQPFFMYVAPTAPHLPLKAPPRYAGHEWEHASVPKPPNYDEANVSDKSRWLRSTAEKRSALMPWTETDYRNRMGSLLALDDLVAGVVGQIEASGELDNTLIVFTSDNGYNNGSHRLIHKMAPYEESVRVPLVMAGAGVRHGRTSAFTLQTDFAATFLRLAGARVPRDTDGMSLTPMMQGPAPLGWRTDFLTQYASLGAANGMGTEMPEALLYWFYVHVTAQDIPSYRALHGTRWVLIEWYGDGTSPAAHEYELYDLRHDPYQLHNLLATRDGRQRHAARVAVMKARMSELLACEGRECRS